MKNKDSQNGSFNVFNPSLIKCKLKLILKEFQKKKYLGLIALSSTLFF